jgi:hypothetical protein
MLFVYLVKRTARLVRNRRLNQALTAGDMPPA